VVSIFDTLVFVVRSGGRERVEAVYARKKRAENRLVHHEFMPAAMFRNSSVIHQYVVFVLSTGQGADAVRGGRVERKSANQ
jgi:hypothetical protein